ncbi:MAG TPA: cytochrome b/b6 domain-containing protein [Acidiferrobacterales bacterium]|nr:cytochrome b/b6 domain-containing protein [Acidiferrobacterales bacterium]
MSAIPIQRTRVWSSALRIGHWLLALCVLTLLISGWALSLGLADIPQPWRDAHVAAGAMLGIALLFRIVLLVAGRTPTDRWRDCLPLTRQQWHGARAMLVFYLSLGRVPLPAWYGHNPLWGPLYLLLFAVLVLGVATGLLIAQHDPQSLQQLAATPWWLGWTLPEWHIGLAWVICGFSVAHVLSVFLHDARGTTSEISAMVNGHKIFLTTHSPQELVARIDDVRDGVGTSPHREHSVKVLPRKPAGK